MNGCVRTRGNGRLKRLAVALLAEKAGIEVEEAQILVDGRVVEEKLRILIVVDEPAVRQLVQR